MSCARNHNPCAYGLQGWSPSTAPYYPNLERVRRIDWFHIDPNSSSTGTGKGTPVITVRDDILSFRVRCNASNKPNDVGGTFMPEAFYFSYFNSAPIESTYVIDNGECISDENGELKKPIAKRFMKRAIFNALGELTTRKKVIAFFCHGLHDSLQLGFNLRNKITFEGNYIEDEIALARAISNIGTSDVRVVLYACDAGQPNGFAAKLFDELVLHCPDCLVDAHTNTAHATWNPNVIRFDDDNPTGQMIVPDDHTLWPKWQELLSNPFGTQSILVWKYSQMTRDKIHRYLESFGR